MTRTAKERAAMRVSGNAIVSMAHECQRYIKAYETLYEAKLADDGVLGDALIDILRALLVLLNGELGTHDAGTLDTLIRDIAEEGGWNRDLQSS